MQRRSFLRTAAGAAAGLAAAGLGAGCRTGAAPAAGGAPSETPNGMSNGARAAAAGGPPPPVPVGALPPMDRVGLQLSTVRALLDRDIEDGFRQVAAVGYRNVETSADLYEKRKPDELRAILDRHGLRTTVGLYRREALAADLPAVARAARTLGQQYVGLPSFGGGTRTSRDDYARAAAEFTGYGRRLRDEGLTLTYHNHAFEFEPLPGGARGFDVLLAETDPAAVAFEMDLYWVDKGGADPVAYMERHPGRFHLLHIKDSTPAPEKAFAPVGEGRMDFRTILTHAGRGGMRYGFVEHDQPRAPLDSIRASFAALTRLLPRA